VHKENGMAIDQVDQTVVTRQPTVVAAPESVPTTTSQETVRTERRHLTRSGPGGSEMARRIIGLLFGLIQIVIGLRIVLLLLDARTGNALVSGILDISKIFVAPFDGILNSNALTAVGWVDPRRGGRRRVRRLDHPRADRALGRGHLPARAGLISRRR
jgi:hypothetical protein